MTVSMQNQRKIMIAMAITGTILFPATCIVFGQALLANISLIADPTIFTTHTQMELSDLVVQTAGIVFGIFVVGLMMLLGWIMTFIEYGYDKKYAKYLNIVPIFGGIIFLIGLNAPKGVSGGIMFVVGGTILFTGLAGKMGLFGAKPDRIEEGEKL